MSWIYHQKTGRLYHDGRFIGTGYSGYGKGRNNPDFEGHRLIGAVRRGRYRLAEPKSKKEVEDDTMVLVPELHKSHYPYELFIRGEGGALVIVFNSAIRKQLRMTGAAEFTVLS